MRLLSLNVELGRFPDRILPYIQEAKPDIICLQEATELYVTSLKQFGYQVTYLPRCISMSTNNINREIDGVLLATREPHSAQTFYYHQHSAETPVEFYDEASERLACNQGVIYASTSGINVATTQFTWTPNGSRATTAQTEDMSKLLAWLETKPQHILCGDFNLARSSHSLYQVIAEQYKDNIPAKYSSSLDRSLHRFGDDPERSQLFTEYMVDYLWSKPQYTVTNVALEFGLSDHAAVTGTISKE